MVEAVTAKAVEVAWWSVHGADWLRCEQRTSRPWPHNMPIKLMY